MFHLHVLSWPSPQLQIPVTWLLGFEVITVLLAVPFFSSLFARCKSRGHSPSPAFRIGLGMMFGALSMGCAGIVEYWRIEIFISPNGTLNQNISGTLFYASTMPIYYQVPQYVFMGCSDALLTVAALECAYTMAPRSLQSVISGMLYFSTGVASLIGFFLMELTDTVVFKKNADYGSINSKNKTFCIFFFGLGIFQTLGLAAFVLITRWILRPVPQITQRVIPAEIHSGNAYDPDSPVPPNIEWKKRWSWPALLPFSYMCNCTKCTCIYCFIWAPKNGFITYSKAVLLVISVLWELLSIISSIFANYMCVHCNVQKVIHVDKYCF